ncbi:hypothetical protein CICLE_v10003707mg, partial [Citrus x clementina]
MTGYNYGELTEDLLVETLSRLPVKSLMRFMCVSKSWFSLVKDPNFICKHLNRDDHKRLMIYIGYYDIFCLSKQWNLNPINLWNVSLNEYRILPKPPNLEMALVDERGMLSINDGFPIIEVYNFSTKSWRDVEERLFPLECYLGGEDMNNVYQKGFCYWVALGKKSLRFCDYFHEMKGPP